MTKNMARMPMREHRAEFEPSSFNPEKRTVEIVFSTGARVKRYDWWTGQSYFEELSLDPSHVRMHRLEKGAPVLNTHRSNSLSDQIGVVDQAWLVGKEGRATLRLSDRPEIAGLVSDIEKGIIRNVSVGYKIHKMVEVERIDDIPVMRAEDWEPIEISFVPAGADPDSGTRSEPDLFECEIIRSITVPEPVIAEVKPTVPAAAPVATVDHDQIRSEGAVQERARVSGIMDLATRGKLGSEWAQKHVDSGASVDTVRVAAIDEVMARQVQAPVSTNPVAITVDETEKRREGMENFLLHRAFPQHYKLEAGQAFRSCSWFDIAKRSVEATGIRTDHLSKNEVLKRAFHSTSDFPVILENIATKTLRDSYARAPQTWRPFTRVTTLPDFKPVSRVQLGDGPEFKKVLEGGEFTKGTIPEAKEGYKLETYGRIIAVTRQLIINDDLNAFSRSIELLSRRAAELESNLVYSQLIGNPTMGDGVALFHATHGNLVGSGTVLSITSLGIMRAMLRMQKGLARKASDSDKPEYLRLTPAFLIVPTALETIAQQFLTQITANVNGSVNPFAGSLQLIVDPRLDDASTTTWYIAASPSETDTIELAYLQGEEGLQVETEHGFEIDGMMIKGRIDVGAKVIDYRGFAKNPGA